MSGSPWAPTTAPPSLLSPTGHVSLVEGRTFCLSGRSGDIVAGRPEGLFLLDTRLLSRLELSIGSQFPEPLSVDLSAPSAAVFVSRSLPEGGKADSTLLIMRKRYVGQGMREDIVLRNFSLETVQVPVSLKIESDFADLFAVKDGRADRRARTAGSDAHYDRASGELRFVRNRPGLSATVLITAWGDPGFKGGSLVWEAEIPPGEEWTACFGVSLIVGSEEIEPLYRLGEPISLSEPVAQLRTWREGAPVVQSDYTALDRAVSTSVDDIGSLRIFDPEFPDEPVIAAGAPWFMTLFGRDAIISAWMSLTVDPELALGVLDTLARLQGNVTDPKTEEEPGRILHEVRFDRSLSPSLSDSSVYYGTADATPLFVMLLGELRRWGLAPDDVDRLLPHADRALEWIRRHGDRDGDGFVEYQRSTPDGLANQGWKDSWDAVSFADGRLAEAPIALAEVQGYVYAAYRSRAYFAREAGDADTDTLYSQLADELRDAFNAQFWLEDRGYYAIALDGAKKPIDSLASNMGHCLLTGIIDPVHAGAVVDALMSEEMFSGWGIRTLASSMARYNPISYHNGSVWPHDNAMIAAGMMRYGYVTAAHDVVTALLEAAEACGGRLPELFGGMARSEMNVPVVYPTSCSPQAWAAAAPLLMLRTILRFDPWVPFHKLWVAPSLPDSLTRITVDGIPLLGGRISIQCDAEGVRVEGLDESGVELISQPRPPIGGGLVQS